MSATVRRLRVMSLALALLALAVSRAASAHCDTIDGPVAEAGRKALDTGAIEHAVVWVKPDHEGELREIFARVLEVRRLDAGARELADRYFLETLVRLHRAGEGAPYTGLKPAGEGHTRAIRAADGAVASGSIASVRKLLSRAMGAGLQRRFDEVKKRRRWKVEDVEAGREYVEAYVSFVHYVEGLHRAIAAAGAHEAH